MSNVERSIEVNAPVSAAYSQWARFEEFPNFMEGVLSVTRVDDRTFNWRAVVGGTEKTWTAEIVEQVPDKRIIWQSQRGSPNAGAVRFEPAGDQTLIRLEMSYDPEGFVENVGDALGVMTRRLDGDLERFKAYIERAANNPPPAQPIEGDPPQQEPPLG